MKRLVMLLCILPCFAVQLLAAETNESRGLAKADSGRGTSLAAPAPVDRLKWFRDARFGMFIHWGLYSVTAGEWKGRSGYREWIQQEAKIPCAEYDALTNKFNPVKFDARAWVRLAKEAGMKYIVITTKHHDGFCMFDSKLTDFDIAEATPFRRDPLKDLAEACQEEGIRFCVYYSISDWHHPECPAKYIRDKFHGQPKKDADIDKYVAFMKGQVRELLTNYGPIGVVWFDGGEAFKGEDRATLLHAREIVDMIHELQPGCVVNDRLGFGDYGTPEQFIPGEKGTRAFEVCMTINGSWGFNKNDQNWKSAEVLIRNLVDIVSKNGNYLLNVGPTAEGEIPGPSIERLTAMGAWMKVNGEAIHGAAPTLFGGELGRPKSESGGKQQGAVKAQDWRCTVKPGKIYIHFLKWPGTSFRLPAIAAPITKVSFLADPSRADVPFKQEADAVTFTLPSKAPAPVIPVLCIETQHP